jgi:hypothetical protein
VTEVPHEFSILRELQDAVLRCGSRDPYETLPIDKNGLQRCRPERMVSRTSPRMDHVAFLVHLDDFRTTDATIDLTVGASDFIGISGCCAVQEPYVVIRRNIDAGHLLHTPSIGQRLRPERINLVHWRAIGVEGMYLPLLRKGDRNYGKNYHATQHKRRRLYAA